jgi:glycerophosphoryl diester phosphodiesterase
MKLWTRAIMMKLLARTLSILAAVLITIPLLNLGAHAVTNPPSLIGHRGIGDPWTVELNIPEQSIPAIEWAAANHADIVEGDVQVTRNGGMVMMHDATLDRTTNRTGRVIDRDTSYITAAYLELPVDRDGNGNDDNTSFHPPTFQQWLAACKKATGKLCFVELKESEHWSRTMVKAYVAEIDRQAMRSRVITAGSETRLSYFSSYSSGARSWSVAHKPSTDKLKSVVGPTGYFTLSLVNAEADPAYVTNLQSAGLKGLVYTLDNPGHYARALPLGFYGWMCDNTGDAWGWLQGPNP